MMARHCEVKAKPSTRVWGITRKRWNDGQTLRVLSDFEDVEKNGTRKRWNDGQTLRVWATTETQYLNDCSEKVE